MKRLVMAANGNRFPRERFTKSLMKLLDRLDSFGKVERDFEYSLFSGGPVIRGKAQFWPERVWAFGSYARGAAECGDLDLIVSVGSQWLEGPSLKGMPPPECRLLKREVFGSYPHVHMIPMDQYKHMNLDESEKPVLVWQKGTDWRSILSSIKVDSSKGHFDRKHDALPIRLEQTSMNVREGEALIDAVESGVLTMEFRPFGSLLSVEQAELQEDELEFMEVAGRHYGKQAMKVLPAFLVASRGDRRGVPVQPWSFGEVALRLGAKRVWASDLDSPMARKLFLVPYWTGRGPNGVMVLSRGRKHPQRVAFKRCKAYTVGEGIVSGDRVLGGVRNVVREVFSSKERAQEEAACRKGLKVLEHKGDKVLELALGVLAIKVDGKTFDVLDEEGSMREGQARWLERLRCSTGNGT